MRFNRDSSSRGGFGRSSYGGRREGGWSDVPKPVKAGEEYDVEITEVGSKGDGITRIKNFIVFVDGAKKGEKIKIKITEVMNRFAIGQKVGDASAASSEESESSEEIKEEPEQAEESEETMEDIEEPVVTEESDVSEETEETEEQSEETVEEDESVESDEESEEKLDVDEESEDE